MFIPFGLDKGLDHNTKVVDGITELTFARTKEGFETTALLFAGTMCQFSRYKGVKAKSFRCNEHNDVAQVRKMITEMLADVVQCFSGDDLIDLENERA